ncbi:MAG: glycosyltransferase [Desulfobacterales bacterium]|nr:glycosyltransferase [Desulfobacterales bacterium]
MLPPTVSIIMPVYNGELYLKEAIESILNQTLTDFEFIIIDDGSSDATRDIIKSFHDKRILLLCNDKNIGLTRSLNIGLNSASGKYIARQDADDVSLPIRLQKQVSYLRAYPDVALLGTWAKCIDEKGNVLREIRPTANKTLLRWRMMFNNRIIHSTAMFDSQKIKQLGGYDEKADFARDYELWRRIMNHYDVAQLPEILILWRNHCKSITAGFFDKQEEKINQIVHENIQAMLNKKILLDDVRALRELLNNRSVKSAELLKNASDILQEVYFSVAKKRKADKGVIKKDYARMARMIAANHANVRRKGSFDILQNSIRADKSLVMESKTFLCILKIALGPRLITKIRNLINPL